MQGFFFQPCTLKNTESKIEREVTHKKEGCNFGEESKKSKVLKSYYIIPGKREKWHRISICTERNAGLRDEGM